MLESCNLQYHKVTDYFLFANFSYFTWMSIFKILSKERMKESSREGRSSIRPLVKTKEAEKVVKGEK